MCAWTIIYTAGFHMRTLQHFKATPTLRTHSAKDAPPRVPPNWKESPDHTTLCHAALRPGHDSKVMRLKSGSEAGMSRHYLSQIGTPKRRRTNQPICVHWRFAGSTPRSVPFYQGEAIGPVFVFEATRKTNLVVRARLLQVNEKRKVQEGRKA